jgi:KDO2-lipid IV(A) lauroyltransferase
MAHTPTLDTTDRAASPSKATPPASSPAPAPSAPPPSALRRWWTRASPGLKFRGFKALSWLSGHAPLAITYALAVVVGDCIYLFSHEHSSYAVSNMRRVLGPGGSERAARRAARQSFRNYCKTLADFIRFPYMQPEEMQRRVAGARGLEAVDRALAQGKGVLAITAHVGNWDFAGAFMGRRGVPMYALADRFEPPQLDEWVIETRRRNGVEVIPMEAAAMRTIFSALKRNELVILLADRPMPDDGVPVQFFGETAWLPSGPAAIALKTGAPIVFGYCLRQKGDIKFGGAVELLDSYKPLLTGNKQTDTEIITQALATAFEGLIRRAPSQWYMFRPMWPRPTTVRELRRARRAARRAALRGRVHNFTQRPSIMRLRRRRRDTPDLRGTAFGISVDPPEFEAANMAHPPEESRE